MNTATSRANPQRAQQRPKTAAQQHHQQVTSCVCGASTCAVLLWLVEFFGACFVYVIDGLSFAAAVVGSIAIPDGNYEIILVGLFGFKTFASMVLTILYFRS